MAAAKSTTALAPRTVELNTPAEVFQVAQMLYSGGLAPPGIGSPNAVAAVILAGMEVGLAPTQALGSIMLTNGRLTIYGDGALALVRASGLLEAIDEKVEGEGPARTGRCVVKRKGEPDRTFTFSMAEADRAGLIERARGKGPWATYPDRMLIMRARGFALRDVFPDVLRGLVTHEEAADTADDAIVVEATRRPEVRQATPTATSPPAPAPVSPPELPAASSAPAAPPAPPAAPAAVTPEQLTQIANIRQGYLNGKLPLGEDEKRAAWSELLRPYNVESAKQFTAEQAAAFIAAEGPRHDPLSHGPASSKT